MVKRTLLLLLILLAPIQALAAPCCDTKGAKAAMSAAGPHSAACAKMPGCAKCPPGASKSRCATKSTTSSARVVATPQPVQPILEVASRVAPLPHTPPAVKAPVQREPAPRVGPLFLAHQALQI